MYALVDLGSLWISVAFIFAVFGAGGLLLGSGRNRFIGTVFGVVAVAALLIHFFLGPNWWPGR